MFRAKFIGVGLVLAFLVLLVTGTVWSGSADPARAQAKAKDARVKELRKERLTLLQQAARQIEQEYVTGKVPFDRVQGAQQAVLQARLDLAESEKERIAILEEVVALAKGYEKTATQRYRTGNAPGNDPLLAKASRLEAEIALELAKARIAAKPK